MASREFRSPFSTLPDELVTQILNWSTFDKYRFPSRAFCVIISLALVCRRFHRIVTPFLFEDIGCSKVDHTIVPPCEQILQLHRVLKYNPQLRSKCFYLCIEIDHHAITTNEDFAVARDLVSWLTNVRTLLLVGGFERWRAVGPRRGALAPKRRHRQNVLNLIRHASQSMPALKDFQIIDVSDADIPGITLAEAMDYIEFPSLEELNLHINGRSDSARISKIAKKSRCAPMKRISLNYCKDTHEALIEFIRWPKALTSLAIRTKGRHLDPFVPYDFQELFSVHKDTLTFLNIELGRNGSLFDVSNFPNLEVLELSRGWDPLSRALKWSPSHADLLLAPNLHTLVIKFDACTESLRHLLNFGDLEEEWSREFARTAAVINSKLACINLQVGTSSCEISGTNGESQSHALADLAGDIKMYGVTLRHSEELNLIGMVGGHADWDEEENIDGREYGSDAL
ncbi:F-box domain protein [Penicillium riverlandense]|uniref:F-box domain protein n=1 Tax=Penicillium riverlandense TaxID=1903569 RepID=UPI0025487EF5|nr:F-box domain protein [Penicillium riverlandense]KAJ5832737.1 F-box domain protein [Penicillium riverlandense]